MRRDMFEAAKENDAFRRELVTGPHSQIVLMTIQPGDEIGEEVHDHVDQVLIFVEGDGRSVVEGREAPVRPNDVGFVSAGTRHNFVNDGGSPLRLISIYSPPEHPAGTVHLTKEEADAAEHH